MPPPPISIGAHSDCGPTTQFCGIISAYACWKWETARREKRAFVRQRVALRSWLGRLSPRSPPPRTAVSSCGRAPSQNSCALKRPDVFLRPELPPVDAGLAIYRSRKIVRPLRLVFRKCRGACHPAFPFDRHTLRDRRAFRQHATEVRVMPVRRKMNPVVMVSVAVDQTGERGERQVKTVDRMREQQRIAVRCLDRPEIMEFDQKAVGVEQRRAADLAGIVESERRTHEADLSAWRQIVVPGEFAILNLYVADQRYQKAAGH